MSSLPACAPPPGRPGPGGRALLQACEEPDAKLQGRSCVVAASEPEFCAGHGLTLPLLRRAHESSLPPGPAGRMSGPGKSTALRRPPFPNPPAPPPIHPLLVLCTAEDAVWVARDL